MFSHCLNIGNIIAQSSCPLNHAMLRIFILQIQLQYHVINLGNNMFIIAILYNFKFIFLSQTLIYLFLPLNLVSQENGRD